MDPDVLKLAQVLAVVAAFSGVFVAFGLLSKLVTGRTKRPKRERAEGLPGIDEARFARLEAAVDTIAVEVERIAEAQRFSARLLAERAEARIPEPREERSGAPGHRSPIPG